MQRRLTGCRLEYRWRGTMRRTFASILAIALSFQAGSAGAETRWVGDRSDVSPEELSEGVADRMAFGLPSDPQYVQSLMASSADVGTIEWGIPLTAGEMAELDLARRGAFQIASEQAISFARSLAGFGGAYFDQADGGVLTLQFTELADEARDQIMAQAADSIPTHIVSVQHSFSALQNASARVFDIAPVVAPTATIVSAGISEPDNAVSVTVLNADMGTAGLADELAEGLGVPVNVELAAGPAVPGACGSRAQLCTPTRGGIRIGTTAGSCSMGFHVITGSDVQFVTAGHCSDQPSQSKTWYQPSPTTLYLGTQQSQLFFPNTNYSLDVQRIQLPNSQASTHIFGENRQIVGHTPPVSGQAVCSSLGFKDINDCGTVTVAVDYYTLEGYIRIGARTTGIVTQGGDSGSPLFVRSGNYSLYGVAIYSAGNDVYRWWPSLTNAFTSWGSSNWDIYH